MDRKLNVWELALIAGVLAALVLGSRRSWQTG